MARNPKDLGMRRGVRVGLRKTAFLIPAPDAAWIECIVVDVSDHGVCLDVGALAVSKMFGLAFTADGEVRRLCTVVWRRGERLGARFVTASELRQGRTTTEADR